MNENKLSLDTESQVFFYEQDHYYLSNFSAFAVSYDFVLWPTAEHAYQAQKFAVGPSHNRVRIRIIENMRSAHEAFKYAEAHKEHRRHDWDDVKVAVMRDGNWQQLGCRRERPPDGERGCMPMHNLA